MLVTDDTDGGRYDAQTRTHAAALFGRAVLVDDAPPRSGPSTKD